MTPEANYFKQYSDEWLLEKYLTYGSVEAVFANITDSLPISIPHYHRLVKKYGIIKSAGRREVSLTETLQFFIKKALEPTAALAPLYREMPWSFQTSLASLHRIYSRIMNRTPGRFATALLLHDPDNQNILMGRELHSQALQAKFKGDLSLPMTFSGRNETSHNSIARVIQQEVFTNQAIHGLLPISIPDYQTPAFTIEILDVEVRVFELLVNSEALHHVNSFKLHGYQLVSPEDIGNTQSVRYGMSEILNNWQSDRPVNIQSYLNQQLLAI